MHNTIEKIKNDGYNYLVLEENGNIIAFQNFPSKYQYGWRNCIGDNARKFKTLKMEDALREEFKEFFKNNKQRAFSTRKNMFVNLDLECIITTGEEVSLLEEIRKKGFEYISVKYGNTVAQKDVTSFEHSENKDDYYVLNYRFSFTVGFDHDLYISLTDGDGLIKDILEEAAATRLGNEDVEHMIYLSKQGVKWQLLLDDPTVYNAFGLVPQFESINSICHETEADIMLFRDGNSPLVINKNSIYTDINDSENIFDNAPVYIEKDDHFKLKMKYAKELEETKCDVFNFTLVKSYLEWLLNKVYFRPPFHTVKREVIKYPKESFVSLCGTPMQLMSSNTLNTFNQNMENRGKTKRLIPGMLATIINMKSVKGCVVITLDPTPFKKYNSFLHKDCVDKAFDITVPFNDGVIEEGCILLNKFIARDIEKFNRSKEESLITFFEDFILSQY